MPEETAVVDAVVETPLDVAEEVQQPADDSAVETETSVAEPKPDDRAFAGKMRELHKQLSASQDPADQRAAKELKQLFFSNKALKEEFPGGLSEVRQLKETVAKLGAPEEIEAAKDAASTLEAIDEKWLAADPAFLDELISLNADSFKKLMPVGIGKWAQADPEGYQRTMSGIVHSTLINSRLDTQLMLLSDAVDSGNKEKALGLLKGIEDWMGKLDETAKSVPQPETAKQPSELDQRQQQLDERESALFNQSLAGEYASWQTAQIKSQLAKLRPGKPIDPERYEIFEDRVRREVSKMVDPDFQAKFEALYNQKDKDGCLKLSKAQTDKHLSKAVTKVHALLFPGAQKKSATPTNGNGQQSKPAEQGWTKILQRPTRDEINRERGATTDDMILAGKAILKSGKRVMWDRV